MKHFGVVPVKILSFLQSAFMDHTSNEYYSAWQPELGILLPNAIIVCQNFIVSTIELKLNSFMFNLLP